MASSTDISRLSRNDALFIAGAWLVSRALIVVPIMLDPAAPSVPFLQRIMRWDATWFGQIVQQGYNYVPDGVAHNVGFFPLFPMVWAALTRVGVPLLVGGPLVNNVAFALMLVIVFLWATERYGRNIARWTIATLCFVPMTVFGTFAYSEGLFMLLSAAALRDFENARYVRASVWAAFASATRAIGLALLPAFACAAFFEKRKPAAYLTAASVATGPLLFALYCLRAFGDPFAYARVQAPWRHALGFTTASYGDVVGWDMMVRFGLGLLGDNAWRFQVAIALVIVFWWQRYRLIPPFAAAISALLLVLAEVSFWNDARTIFLFVAGGLPAVVAFTRRLGAAPATFALIGALIVVLSGPPISVDRILYGLVPISLALAMLWDLVPTLGAPVLAVYGAYIPDAAMRFVEQRWVA